MVETGMAAPLAILSALAEEQSALILQLQGARSVQHAGRTFWLGELEGHSVILATSRIGKVSAAITALQLIEAFGARSIVFTGVAGGVGPGVAVGDVVVASSFLQHDMDCSPLFPRYEIPLYGRAVLTPDADLTAGLLQACMAALEMPLAGRPRAAIHLGRIVGAVGDGAHRSKGHTVIVAHLRYGRPLHLHGQRCMPRVGHGPAQRLHLSGCADKPVAAGDQALVNCSPWPSS